MSSNEAISDDEKSDNMYEQLKLDQEDLGPFSERQLLLLSQMANSIAEKICDRKLAE